MSVVRNLAYDPDREVRRARLRGRAGRMGARRRAAGRGAQQHQGRGQHAQPRDAAGTRRSTPRCSTPASTAQTLDAMLAGRARVVPRLPPLPARQGARARPGRSWPGTTSSRRSAAAARAWSFDDGDGIHRRAVRQLLAATERFRRARLPRALDRRRAAPRQARRRVLHAVCAATSRASSPTSSRRSTA